MPPLKDGNDHALRTGYYLQDVKHNIAYIHKRRESWFAQFPQGGLVILTPETSRYYHKMHDQKQAEEDFAELSESLANNLEKMARS